MNVDRIRVMNAFPVNKKVIQNITVFGGDVKEGLDAAKNIMLLVLLGWKDLQNRQQKPYQMVQTMYIS